MQLPSKVSDIKSRCPKIYGSEIWIMEYKIFLKIPPKTQLAKSHFDKKGQARSEVLKSGGAP